MNRSVTYSEQQAIIAAIKAGRPRADVAHNFRRSLHTVKRIWRLAW